MLEGAAGRSAVAIGAKDGKERRGGWGGKLGVSKGQEQMAARW